MKALDPSDGKAMERYFRLTACLVVVLALSGCGTTEKDCYERMTASLTDEQIDNGVAIQMAKIWMHDDLDLCDFAVVGNELYKK